jgi:hypothetical protein
LGPDHATSGVTLAVNQSGASMILQ